MMVKQILRKLMSDLRYRKIKKFLIGKSLDVACEWRREMFDVCCDLNPKNDKIEKQDIRKLTYKNNSFDTVCCLQVLEHIYNPLQAINELKRVARKRIIISVPFEPWFSLCRLSWNKEHLWAIRPEVLEHYIGKPSYKKIFLFRWYLMIFEVMEENPLWLNRLQEVSLFSSHD